VTFTSLSGSSFQWFYVGTTQTTTIHLADTYTATMPIGPIPITGTIGTPQASGGAFTWSISFSGSYTGTVANFGNATETHTYVDINGNQDTETWLLPDQQAVSFSGTMTGNVANLSFGGTISETVQANWIGAEDSLPPSNPNHHSGPGQGPFNPDLGPFESTLDFGIPSRRVTGNLM
jgi:hypothetical protein